MNLWGPVVLLYLLVGGGVAAAVYLSDLPRTPGERTFQVATAPVFWPLYLPLLLARPGAPPSDAVAAGSDQDDLATAIAQADAELAAALASFRDWAEDLTSRPAPERWVLAALDTLDGWADGVLAREQSRIEELRRAWNVQARRIREMDRVLAATAAEEASQTDRFPRSREARREVLERLRAVREQTYDELLVSLDRVRELASRIHLARFTGAPPSRAEELITQIAAAIEGLSSISSAV